MHIYSVDEIARHDYQEMNEKLSQFLDQLMAN